MLKIKKRNIYGLIVVLLIWFCVFWGDDIFWGIQYVNFKIDLGNDKFVNSKSSLPLLYYEKISANDIARYLNQSNHTVALIKVITTPNGKREKILSEIHDFRDKVFKECYMAGLKWIQMPIPRKKNTIKNFIKYYKSRKWE